MAAKKTKKAEAAKSATPAKEIKPKSLAYVAIGRRKNAVARVKLQLGNGKISINERDPKRYFTSPAQRRTLFQPLETASLVDRVDLAIKARGGGLQAQAEAARLGISRAIILLDKEHRPVLKTAGFLRRDSRKKERKKYGLKRARRAPQFSKR